MYVDDVEFSNNDNSDNDYEADNDLDCYLSDEDVQPQFRKMEPFQDSSVPHNEPKYIVSQPATAAVVNLPFLFIHCCHCHLCFER